MIYKNRKFKFYKTQGAWYIDFPEYIEAGGEQADLEMVLGADDFLNYLSGDSEEIELYFDLDKRDEYNWDYIDKATNNPAGSGATYVYLTNEAIYVLWLCDVTSFLFGEFPEIIYFKKHDKSLIK